MVGIFNMHADVDVCDSTQGLYRHCKSQHWELTGRKIPCHTRGLVLHQHCAWRFSSSCSTSVPLILTSSILGGSFHIEIEASRWIWGTEAPTLKLRPVHWNWGPPPTLKLRPHVEFEALRLPHWNWGIEALTLKLRPVHWNWGPPPTHTHVEIEAPTLKFEALRPPTLKLRHWGPHIGIGALRPPHWNWGPLCHSWVTALDRNMVGQ